MDTDIDADEVETKRAALKALIDDLTDEGVTVLWPVLRWWVDPSRCPAPTPHQS
jgi:hypothetical protein